MQNADGTYEQCCAIVKVTNPMNFNATKPNLAHFLSLFLVFKWVDSELNVRTIVYRLVHTI